MISAQTWGPVEERLVREASSLGGFLEQLPRISPVLIDAREWERLVERAFDLPVTMAAFPVGFELPLHDLRPGAALGGMVVGGSRSAAFFEKAGQSEDADSSAKGIAWLLAGTEPQDSLLRRIAGRTVVLEYDIDAVHGAHPPPALFLGPAAHTQGGDSSGEPVRALDTVAGAVAAAAGRRLGSAERRQIERVYLAMPPETRVTSVGTFPARGGDIRLAVTGFRLARDVMAFLKRTGWPGERAVAAGAISALEGRGAFAYMAVHFDVGTGGLGPKLGLSFFARERSWLPDFRPWMPLLDGLRGLGLVNADKGVALANSSSGAELLFGKAGAFTLQCGIHHIKLVLKGDRFEQTKAYRFLVTVLW